MNQAVVVPAPRSPAAPVRVKTSAPASLVKRCGATPCAPGGCGGRHDEDTVRRQAAGTVLTSEVPGSVHAVLSNPGRPLNPQARLAMEAAFGHDFGHVRIHDGPAAEDSARHVRALAYTVGRRVVLGSTATDRSPAGYPLLAHELTHVLQQGGRAGDVRPSAVDTEVDSPSEREAAAAAARLAPGSAPGRAEPALVQRQGETGGTGGGGGGGGGGRPVYLCSKPIMGSWLHGQSHAFFRVGGSGAGNETYELEHGNVCLGCYRGYPRHNEPEDVNAAADCVAAPSISEAALASNWDHYPIGQYCPCGPNSNTYVKEIVSLCGGGSIRPPGRLMGYDDSPPKPGTYGPEPYESALGCICYDPPLCKYACRGGSAAPP